MSYPNTERDSLVYVQDDGFLTQVGEPVELTSSSRIVVAKADAISAEAVRVAVGEAFPASRAEVFLSGNALMQSLRDQPADFAVIGLTFTDLDGIDVLESNAREHFARRVFIVSSRKDEQSLHALRVVRFDGFLDPAEEPAGAVAPALRQVANGRGYISAALCRRLIERRAGVLTQRLTSTERIVLAVIGDGSDDEGAAERLGLRKATIQSHRRNVMRKLDVATSARLVAEAVRLGVVRILPDGQILRPGFERLLCDWQDRRNLRADGETAGDYGRRRRGP